MNFFKKILSRRKRQSAIKRIELWLMLGLLLVLTLAFVFFGEEIKDFSLAAVERFGLYGLFGITVVMDTIIQPLPPDLLVLSYTLAEWPLIFTSLVGGFASVLAGVFGYGIGYFLEEKGIDKYVGKKNYKRAHNLFLKHGFLAIAIGALTPIPFSSICWSAGIFRMNFKYFLISILVTRIPRFLFMGYVGALFA